jgi:hypothetical protein
VREQGERKESGAASSDASSAPVGKGIVLQRRAEAPEAIEAHVDSTRGGGDRLGGGVLQRMNDTFGHDFSGVGIHHDADAASACREMGAQAFTVGNDVYFGEGKYEPGSTSGQELLGHELTHVVQQRGGQASGAQAKLAVGGSSDPAEHEADAMGAKAAAAPGAGPAGPAGPADPAKPERTRKKGEKGEGAGTPVSASAEELRMTPADVSGGDRDYSIVKSVPDVIQSHIAQDVPVTGDTNWKWIWRSRWIVYDAMDQVVDKQDNWKHPDYTLSQATIKKGTPSDGGSNKWTVRFETMETGKPFGGSSGDFPWDQSYFHVYASPIANPAFTATPERGNQIIAQDSFQASEDGNYTMKLASSTSRTDSSNQTITTSMKVSGERESNFSVEVDGVGGGLKDKVGFEAQKSIAKSTGQTLQASQTMERTFSQAVKKGKAYNFTVYPKFVTLTGSANLLSQNMGIVSGKAPATGSIRIWTGYEFVAD